MMKLSAGIPAACMAAIVDLTEAGGKIGSRSPEMMSTGSFRRAIRIVAKSAELRKEPAWTATAAKYWDSRSPSLNAKTAPAECPNK
jgi:hypothetical protein